ncbi:MAG: MBL fold metallo-hydrolase [Planctomycetota bacterium]
MKVTFLGSGTGIPYTRRASPGILVESGNIRLLMDSGPGALRQLARLGINSHQVSHLLYTHFHPDHTSDLITFLFTARYQITSPAKRGLTKATQEFIGKHRTGFRTAPLTIIAPKGLKKFYQNILNLYYKWVVPTTYKLTLKEVLENSFKIGNLNIKSSELKHEKYSVGYRLTGTNNKSLVYSGDTEYCPEIVNLAKGADTLIIDSSAPDQVDMPYHLRPLTMARIASEAKPNKLIMTHLYPVCDEHNMAKQVRKYWPGKVEIARDFKSFKL